MMTARDAAKMAREIATRAEEEKTRRYHAWKLQIAEEQAKFSKSGGMERAFREIEGWITDTLSNDWS
jgi:hypothetical protein